MLAEIWSRRRQRCHLTAITRLVAGLALNGHADIRPESSTHPSRDLVRGHASPGGQCTSTRVGLSVCRSFRYSFSGSIRPLALALDLDVDIARPQTPTPLRQPPGWPSADPFITSAARHVLIEGSGGTGGGMGQGRPQGSGGGERKRHLGVFEAGSGAEGRVIASPMVPMRMLLRVEGAAGKGRTGEGRREA